MSQTWPLTLVCLPIAATSPSLSPCRETLWVLPSVLGPLSLGVPIASLQGSTGGGEIAKDRLPVASHLTSTEAERM